MNTLKKVNVIVTLAFTLIAFGTWFYWENFCIPNYCSLDLRNFTLRPLLWGSTAWAIITGTFLFFPAHVFKKWLMHVGWWGALLSVLYVISVDPRSSNILSPDRGQAAWFAGCVVALISALYLLGWYGISKWRYRTTPAPYTNLSAVLAAGLILYLLT